VVEKFRERLAVNKQTAQKFEGKLFNLWKLSELEFRKRYKITISNRLAALEYLSFSEDRDRTLESIIKLLAIIGVDFDATGQLLIIYSAFVKYLRKKGNTMKQCIVSL
jgi:hypothetical protein